MERRRRCRRLPRLCGERKNRRADAADYQDVSITFKKDFTGDAHISFYWYRSGAYTGVSELECTATQSTRSLSRNTRYDWSFTKGGSYSERDVADANVASLLSGMQVLLKFDAKLDAKEGWKDLGLIGY